MASHSQDLDWDHSAGENLLNSDNEDDRVESLNGITFYNGSLLNESGGEHERLYLTHHQFAFILRSLDEVSGLLKEQKLNRSTFNSQRAVSRALQDRESRKCCKLSSLLNGLIKYNIVFTILIQVVMLVFVTILDITNKSNKKSGKHHGATTPPTTPPTTPKDHNDGQQFEWVTYAVILSFTMINLILVIYISAMITRNVKRRLSTNHWIVAQAYLSTVVVFAGCYVLTYRMDKKSWTLHGFNSEKDALDDGIEVSYLYLKMLFHSISTSTLCGSSAIHPDQWYNFILMAAQMLLSFVYFTSVLSLLISSASAPAKEYSQHRSLRTRLRCSSCTSLTSRNSLNERTPLINGSVGDIRYNGL